MRLSDLLRINRLKAAVHKWTGRRSRFWPAVSAAHLVNHPTCEACGLSVPLVVHHVQPVSANPAAELDPANLITLCHNHHFTLGHCSNWKRHNPGVRELCRLMLAKLR
jgi:5-methylcytosine-specific restriction endonuclease McrA